MLKKKNRMKMVLKRKNISNLIILSLIERILIKGDLQGFLKYNRVSINLR